MLKLLRVETVDNGGSQGSALKVTSDGPGPGNGSAPGGGSAVDRAGQRFRAWIEMLKYRLQCQILSHLQPMKVVFAVLRVVRPVTLVGKVLVVTKASDVRDVLERFDDFVLGETIEPGMPWGPFLMTVDGREQHARERNMLQSVVEIAADTRLIRTIASDKSRACIDALKETGQIDVVADLAEPVMVAVLADYLGISPLDNDERRMAAVMRHLAGIIMVNPPVGSPPWFRSRADIADVTCHVMQQLAAGKAAVAPGPQKSMSPDSLLARLLHRDAQPDNPVWFDEEWIRCYLTGLVATGGATIIRGVTHAVDQLLEQPGALPSAQKLSGALDDAIHLDEASGAPEPTAQLATARDALRGCIYEAMRFRPMLPLLVRTCPRDTIIANGTPRARRVPAGTVVIAPPLAAMFDSEKFPDPYTFRDRPIESYFHFGFGPRRCFGKYIADIVMVEIVRALMRLPGIARANGEVGQVRYDGPAPCSLVVTFNANGSEPVR